MAKIKTMEVTFDKNLSKKRDRVPGIVKVNIEQTHKTMGESIDFWRDSDPTRKSWTIIGLTPKDN